MTGFIGMIRRFCTLFAMLVLLGLSGQASAQGVSNFAGPTPVTADAPEEAPLDYVAWGKIADETETLLANPDATAIMLDQQRAVLAGWRSRFLAAQGTNSTRISTLRAQIEALGPAPAEGEAENADVAARREDLQKQLATLQAPSIAAVEAYSRADGLIQEIDRIQRERQADELLRLLPMPINPANWPVAATALTSTVTGLVGEAQRNWKNDAVRQNLIDNLPAIIGLVLMALVTIMRGRPLIESFALGLQKKASSRGRAVWAFLASLGQIFVPTLGVLAIATAIVMSGVMGPVGDVVAQSLPYVGFAIYAARWLGEQIFPKIISPNTPLVFPEDVRTQGRFLTMVLGLVLGLTALTDVLLPASNMPDAAASVLAFPAILAASILLFRLGQLLRQQTTPAGTEGENISYRNRVVSLIGRSAMIIGFAAPVLAGLGYIAAGNGLVYPAIRSLALVAVLVILQRLVVDIYAMIMRDDELGRKALLPVLVGFALTLCAVPLFALIWGARWADITEVFTKMREGFQIGATRISPTDFLLLAVIFGIGLMMTRLLQGALKSSILPKTSLDQGGQNAIVAGVGYAGIFLAGLVGINAAGIDLSGLAIVAGALSVGIGFGMQNIVSNFVSGIILLIERPVSEGDWIEVGGVQGTVKSISVRSTHIQTFDRTVVIVPNTDLVAGQVTNWTRFNLSGRLIVKVGVAYGTDTRRVEKILREIAEAQPLAVMNPPPAVLLVAFGADSLDFEIRIILRDVNFSVAVRSEINHEIARRFAEEGIEIPFGQRDIWLRNPEALQAMVNTPNTAPEELPEPETKPRRLSTKKPQT